MEGDFDINEMLPQPNLGLKGLTSLYLTREQWKKLKKRFDWAGLPKLQDPTFTNPYSGALSDIAGIPVYILEAKKVVRYRRHPCNKRVRLKRKRVFRCW